MAGCADTAFRLQRGRVASIQPSSSDGLGGRPGGLGEAGRGGGGTRDLDVREVEDLSSTRGSMLNGGFANVLPLTLLALPETRTFCEGRLDAVAGTGSDSTDLAL